MLVDKRGEMTGIELGGLVLSPSFREGQESGKFKPVHGQYPVADVDIMTDAAKDTGVEMKVIGESGTLVQGKRGQDIVVKQGYKYVVIEQPKTGLGDFWKRVDTAIAKTSTI